MYFDFAVGDARDCSDDGDYSEGDGCGKEYGGNGDFIGVHGVKCDDRVHGGKCDDVVNDKW
jgi:hypothetical protein